MPHVDQPCPVRRITDGPMHHFFGYYDKSAWNADDSLILGKRVARIWKRPPIADDVAIIGTIDATNGLWTPVAETTAWNWQQGCMLQWLGTAPRTTIVFNSRDQAGDFVATVVDLDNGSRRTIPAPVYGVAPHGREAVSTNFARLHATRPGYGYAGVPDPWAETDVPEDDGVRHIDLLAGAVMLVYPIAAVAAHGADERMSSGIHWINHLQWNPSGTRFAMLHRWRAEGGGHTTRLLTGDPAGGALRLLEASGFVSHYDWRDDETLLAWSLHDGERHYHLYEDVEGGRVDILGAEVFSEDGHCSFAPDRRWLLTDTYPDSKRSERTLIVYDCDTDTRHDVGRFFSDPSVGGEIRCDLHPRWSRDGCHVCFDSIHEGERQMYVIDVSSITASAAGGAG